jgi:hypothetical protein
MSKKGGLHHANEGISTIDESSLIIDAGRNVKRICFAYVESRLGSETSMFLQPGTNDPMFEIRIETLILHADLPDPTKMFQQTNSVPSQCPGCVGSNRLTAFSTTAVIEAANVNWFQMYGITWNHRSDS